MKEELRQIIINTIKDSVSDLLYYDRINDEKLPVGAIEVGVLSGAITTEEIVQTFDEALKERIRL